MDQISKGIKRVSFVFLVLFIAVISYVAYFEMVTAPKIVDNADNKRLWATRSKVLRGTIYDRNNTVLASSTRGSDGISQNRQYIGGPDFAHAIGYASTQYGLTGLEAKYDSYLTASNGNSLWDNIKQLFSGSSTENSNEQKGDNVVTTLDSTLQKKAYDLLGNNKGAVVAINPKTGEILAMVSKPSFDPNEAALEANWKSISTDTNRPLLNRAVSGLYPPGSTFKTVTAASALENISGITNKTFQDNGILRFNSKESLSDFDGEAFGAISFKEAYVHSSNVVFGTIGLQLGNSNLKKTAEDFYFNKDMPSDGIVIDNSRFPTFNSSEKGNIAQSAIGQSEVLATPMEMAMVASTIANNGVMMEPHLVSSVVTSSGQTAKTFAPISLGNVVSPDIANTLKGFMRGVVTDGTGTAANISGLDVAGKTGTADHNENGKAAKPDAWFIGFAPESDPKIAVAVIVEDGGQGGIAAAQIAGGVIQTSLSK